MNLISFDFTNLTIHYYARAKQKTQKYSISLNRANKHAEKKLKKKCILKCKLTV